MKVPIGENETGYLYPMSSGGFWFVVAEVYNKYQSMTYKNFKEKYPHKVGDNPYHRTNHIKDVRYG